MTDVWGRLPVYFLSRHLKKGITSRIRVCQTETLQIHLLRRAVVLEGSIQWDAIAGQQIETVQPEEALHAKAIARRHHNWPPFSPLALHGLEQVDVVIVCNERIDALLAVNGVLSFPTIPPPLTCSHVAEDVASSDIVGYDVFMWPEGAALGWRLGMTVQETVAVQNNPIQSKVVKRVEEM